MMSLQGRTETLLPVKPPDRLPAASVNNAQIALANTPQNPQQRMYPAHYPILAITGHLVSQLP